MRKEKKKVELNFEQVSMDRMSYGCHQIAPAKYTYEFTTYEPVDIETLECFVEVDVPETLSEFRQIHGLSKEELTEWLNKNYKLR